MEVLEKKRHHFVWRFYLESWATNRKIWCLSKQNSKIFCTSTENIGVEKFFYQIKEFTDKDRIFLELLLLDKSDSLELVLFLRMLLSYFLMCTNLRKLFKNDEKGFKLLSEIFNSLGFDESFLKRLTQICINAEEDYYSSIENLSKSHLEKLRTIPVEKLRTVSDERQILNFDFLLYLCSQYFRTPRIKSNIAKLAKKDEKINKELCKKAEKLQPLISIVLSIRMAFYLMKALEEGTVRISLLINKTEIPFITGDQPVINLQADYTSSSKVDKLELFYPLSPNRALLIKDTDYTLEKAIAKEIEDKLKIKQLNRKIFEASEKQVYSNQKEILEELINGECS